MIGECVEIDHPVKALAVQFHKQLHRLHRMDRADHQPVIALAVAVIQMHPQDARIAPGQLRRLRRNFAGKQHMAEIQRDPGIAAPQFAQRQQVGGNIRHQRKRPRLAWLVFQCDVQVPVVVADLRQTGQTVLPHPRVIALKGIIHPVLPHPQRHHPPAHFGQRVQTALRDVHRRRPHHRVRIAERPQPKARIGVIAHRQPVQRHAMIRHDPPQLCRAVVGKMVGIVQIGRVNPLDRCRPCDQIGHRGLARQSQLEGIQTPRIPRTIVQGHGHSGHGHSGHGYLGLGHSGSNRSGWFCAKGSRMPISFPRWTRVASRAAPGSRASMAAMMA